MLTREEKKRETSAKFRADNPNYQKEWVSRNKEKMKGYRDKAYSERKEEILAYRSEWAKRRARERKARDIEWFSFPENHKWVWLVLRLRFVKDMARRRDRANSETGKVRAAAYASIKRMIKLGGKKVRNTRNYIGCDSGTLRNHLASQFSDGMTWSNYGKNGWHIDHRIPLAAFNFSNPAEVSQALHFTNLQPMWAVDNILKADKFIQFQPLLFEQSAGT
jgi:hypothetical protein